MAIRLIGGTSGSLSAKGLTFCLFFLTGGVSLAGTGSDVGRADVKAAPSAGLERPDLARLHAGGSIGMPPAPILTDSEKTKRELRAGLERQSLSPRFPI